MPLAVFPHTFFSLNSLLRPIFVRAFCGIAMIMSAAVLGDENPLQASVDVDETVVVTLNREEVSAADLLGNTALITEQELTDLEAQHPSQLLGYSAGAWLSRGNGQESLLSLRSPVFTGAGSCAEFLVMEDSIPTRASGFCNVNQLFDTNIEQAVSVEVVRGANSALYGSNAIHGVINVLTPKAKHLRSNGLSQFSLGLGEHSYRRMSLRAGLEQKVSLAFNTTHDGGHKDSSRFDQHKLSLNHYHQGESLIFDSVLGVSVLDQQTAGFLQAGENAYRDRSLARRNDVPNAYRKAHSVRWQTNIRAPEKLSQWSLTPYLRVNQMAFLMHFLPGQPVEKNGHQSVGVQIQRRFGEQAESWSAMIGWDSELTRGFLKQTQGQVTQTDSNFLNAVLPEGEHYNFDVNAYSSAFYGHLKWQPTERVSAHFAGRFDSIRYQYDNNILDGNTRDDGSVCGFGGCRYTRPEDSTDQFNKFSALAGVKYRIDSTWSTYLKWDRAFRAPHTAELYRLQNGQEKSDIDGPLANSLEWGIDARRGNSHIDISLYGIDKKDVIFQNADREFVNSAKTRHYGIELDGRWSISDTLALSTAMSWAKHRYDNNPDLRGIGDFQLNNNTIDTAPQTLATMRLDWQFLPSTSSQLEWSHIGAYYINPENTQRYSGHDLANLRIHHALSKRLRLSLQVLNLFDRDYAERADFAFGNHRYFVGEPRSIFVRVDFRPVIQP